MDPISSSNLAATQQALLNSISPTKTATASQDDLMSAVAAQSASTTISALSQNIAGLYDDIQASGSESAVAGFRSAMQQVGSDPTSAFSFINATQQIRDDDAGTFTDLFATIDAMEQAGAGSFVNRFMNTVSNVFEGQGIDATRAVVETAQDITSREDQSIDTLRDNLSSFFNAVDDIRRDENMSAEEKDEQFSNLNQTVTAQEDPTQIGTAIDNFPGDSGSDVG